MSDVIKIYDRVRIERNGTRVRAAIKTTSNAIARTDNVTDLLLFEILKTLKSIESQTRNDK